MHDAIECFISLIFSDKLKSERMWLLQSCFWNAKLFWRHFSNIGRLHLIIHSKKEREIFYPFEAFEAVWVSVDERVKVCANKCVSFYVCVRVCVCVHVLEWMGS